MTFEEMVDEAIFNLLLQGRRSVLPKLGTCAYRGEKGAKCIVGWMIPDECYDVGMDTRSKLNHGLVGLGIESNVAVQGVLSGVLGRKLSAEEIDILVKLQMVHDSYYVGNPIDFVDHVMEGVREVLSVERCDVIAERYVGRKL